MLRQMLKMQLSKLSGQPNLRLKMMLLWMISTLRWLLCQQEIVLLKSPANLDSKQLKNLPVWKRHKHSYHSYRQKQKRRTKKLPLKLLLTMLIFKLRWINSTLSWLPWLLEWLQKMALTPMLSPNLQANPRLLNDPPKKWKTWKHFMFIY